MSKKCILVPDKLTFVVKSKPLSYTWLHITTHQSSVVKLIISTDYSSNNNTEFLIFLTHNSFAICEELFPFVSLWLPVNIATFNDSRQLE